MTATADRGAVLASLLDAPHHDGSELYAPQPAAELGDEAVVRLRTPNAAAERVLLRYVRDGEPHTVEATVDEESDGETWWRASLPVANPVTRYRWLLSGGTTGYAWVNGLGVTKREVSGADDFVASPGHGGPAWHRSAVVYEIFPDRFASSGAATDPPEWVEPRAWGELPTGRGRATPREWFGGDLRGIEQHLDHISSLGANAIYLTPFFPATSTHRYDATTFDRVDPLLGGDDALRSLARAAKEQGIHLIGDLTLNHTGNRHDWFVAASEDEHAPERAFYYFDPSLRHGYEAWFGVKSLPKLDWRAPELRMRMGEVLQRYLALGLDGWRIDVANMVGRRGAIDLNHDVASWARATSDPGLLVAEHGHDFRPDLDGTGWHGAMNYSGFLRPVWWWLRGDDYAEDVFSSAPAPRYGGVEMVDVMRAFRAGVPWQATLDSWPLLDSHDTPRFRTVTGARERQLVGVGLQMTTPGVPMIFAGAELGLEGRWGEDARRTIPWNAPETWDTELLDGYRRLAALRRSAPALAHGGIRYAHVSADAVVYLRETREEQLLCLAARAPHTPISTPFGSLETLYGEDARDGVLPADGPSFHIWRIGK
jgi:alpha-glucosidase